MPQPFLIDTDLGSDDAVALIMALQSPEADVKAITTVSGNVHVTQATRNTLYVVDLCGSDVPVYAGAASPMVERHVDAEFFHGHGGLGTRRYDPPETRTAEATHAVQAIIDTARNYPGLVLVTLGPMTNVALALKQAPDIVDNISRCVVMAGAAATYGNITPAAEYNVWCDPEAARAVFLSGMSVEMVGWEFCIDEYALTADETQQLRAIDTPLAQFAVDCNDVAIDAFHKQTGQRGLSLPDPVTMAIALDRSIATQEQHYVEVEVNSLLTRGMTVVDKLNVAGTTHNKHTWAEAIDAGKIWVTWEIDNARWKNLLVELMR